MKIENKEFTIYYLKQLQKEYNSILDMECMQFINQEVIDDLKDMIDGIDNIIGDFDNSVFEDDFIEFMNRKYNENKDR